MTSSSSSSSSSSSPPSTKRHLAIGSTVRVTTQTRIRAAAATAVDSFETISRRAIVASLSDDAADVSLILDDPAPRPLVRGAPPFLIAPLFRSRGRHVEECDCRVDDVMELLPFERADDDGDDDIRGDAVGVAHLRKSRGDDLFRRRDRASAVGYYEAALGVLSAKSRLVVGASCLARWKGRVAVAEVDCVECERDDDDDERSDDEYKCKNKCKNKYDVTFLDEEGRPREEGCISDEDVLLAIWDDDDDDDDQDGRLLQIRILLNLSRCLLHLAKTDRTAGSGSCFGDPPSSTSSSRSDRYLSSAIVGGTAAIALCRRHIGNARHPHLPELEERARTIRALARFESGVRDFPRAKRDALRVVETSIRPENRRRAEALVREMERAERRRKTLDKKLSREMCRWVQTSMAVTETETETETKSETETETKTKTKSDLERRDDGKNYDNGDHDRDHDRDSSSSSSSSSSSWSLHADHDRGNDTVLTTATESVSSNDTDGENDDVDSFDYGWDRVDPRIPFGGLRPWHRSRGDPRGGKPENSGDFLWVSKRRVCFDVASVLAFAVAMWIVYSQQ